MNSPTEMELRVARATMTVFGWHADVPVSAAPHFVEAARAAIRAMDHLTPEMFEAVARLCSDKALIGAEPTYPEAYAAYIKAASPETQSDAPAGSTTTP
jgi:hypothetical protein